ncbi:MAG: hypothetical protein V7640_190 [Betaproteobacteria bacterium]
MAVDCVAGVITVTTLEASAGLRADEALDTAGTATNRAGPSGSTQFTSRSEQKSGIVVRSVVSAATTLAGTTTAAATTAARQARFRRMSYLRVAREGAAITAPALLQENRSLKLGAIAGARAIPSEHAHDVRLARDPDSTVEKKQRCCALRYTYLLRAGARPAESLGPRSAPRRKVAVTRRIREEQ